MAVLQSWDGGKSCGLVYNYKFMTLLCLERYSTIEPADDIYDNVCSQVVPVYCFDPRHFATSQYGPKKCGVLRAKFLHESVDDLKTRLRSMGSDLLVYQGTPESIMPTLMASAGETTVLAQEEVTDEELRVEVAVRNAIKPLGGSLKLLWGATLYHKDDLPFKSDLADMPDVFTPFKDACEKRCRSVRACVATPASLPAVPADLLDKAKSPLPPLTALGFEAHEVSSAVKLDPRAVLPFKGGETAALARLTHYFWDADCLRVYFETRNGMLGADYSSKFSAWLAHGCLSPRFIYAEQQRYEQTREVLSLLALLVQNYTY